jgi:beta-lactamase regulating signal transducer with metallopeptidase domain
MGAEKTREILGTDGAGLTAKVLPTLLVSDEAEGPFCCQLHQPIIVLPRFLLEGNRDDLRHVLAHEIEHLATNHPLQVFFTHLAQVICWYHPTVWSAATRASLVREFVCDDAAASQGANCAAYLRTLLHIAERCEQTNKAQAIGFSRTSNEIITRAHRLVRLAGAVPRERRSNEPWRKWAGCLLIPITCALALVWLPLDPLSSPRSHWSPWPTWTAKSLHCLGVCVRDYEVFDRRVRLHELSHEENECLSPSDQWWSN